MNILDRVKKVIGIIECCVWDRDNNVTRCVVFKTNCNSWSGWVG